MSEKVRVNLNAVKENGSKEAYHVSSADGSTSQLQATKIADSEAKTAKYRVKNADGTYDVIHFETGANQVIENEDKQFVSAQQKTQYDDNTIFKTDMLTVNSLGGIGSGVDLNNMPVKDLLAKLLYPYVAPTISGSSSPVNGGTFECGNTQTVTSIKAVVTKKSEKITKVEFKDGSEVIQTITEGVANGGTFTATTSKQVSSNKSFTVVATDSTGRQVSANTGGFNFVYPYYVGKCSNDAEINEELVESLTKQIRGRSNTSYSFNCNYERMVLAYPKSHGAIKQILDPNNFDVTGTFGRQEVTITGLDGNPVVYYVYVNSASTVSNFTVRFNY